MKTRVKTHWFNGLHFSYDSEKRVKNCTFPTATFEIDFESSFRVISLKPAPFGRNFELSTVANMTTRFLTFILLVFIICGPWMTIAAQTRRGTASTQSSTQTVISKSGKQGCAGGWSGVITFSKTLKDTLESDEPGIRKNTDRILHKNSRDYDYSARAVVDGSDPNNAKVNTNVTVTDTDLDWGMEKVFDTCNSRENGHWFIIEGNDDKQTQARVTGSARSFNLYVNEAAGTYGFNIAFPDADGVYKREQHTKRSGHCQPKNNEPYDKSENTPTKIEGERFSVDSQKVDPNDPDHLSGTKIWGDDGKGQVRTFIFQVTWRFTRCPQKLLITELKFEHPKFPNPDDWKAVDSTLGTIDGNKVKVKAKVLNMSGETKFADLKIAETYKGDKWNGARPDETLPEGEVSLRLEGGEEREVELVWDTEGQSWFDDGRPHLLHRIKAELSENGQKKDEKMEPLNIGPKPVVLVHGIWSDYKVWEPLYQNLLTESHSYHWKAYLVGEKPEHGLMKTGGALLSGGESASVFENADQLAKYVRFAQEDSNAWHVDMVAHSTGGLVARLYLHKLMPVSPDGRPLVKHLVMLGTPNGGVKCVDVFLGKLGMMKAELNAARELTNDEMLNFNRYVVNTGGAKLSALAGNPVPIICGGLDWNDGLVTVRSATFGVADNGQSNDLNYQLVDAKNFGNFVKPHLVTGPKRTYPIAVKNDPTDWRRWQVADGTGWLGESHHNDILALTFLDPGPRSGGPSAVAEDAIADDPLGANSSFSKEVSLKPGETVNIDIQVDPASNLGMTFMVASSVSVSLLDDKGVMAAKSLAGSTYANSLFRSIYFPKPVTGGTWKLRIQNTSSVEQRFVGYTWSIAAGQPTTP